MKFINFINESILDIPKKTLSKNIWDFDSYNYPVLKQFVYTQLMNYVYEIEKIINIKNVYLTGSILTKQYNKNSDIDVTIEVYHEDLNDIVGMQLLNLIKIINSQYLAGTTYKLNFYIIGDNIFNESNYDGLYDLRSNTWVKEPKTINYNIEKYLDKFIDKIYKIDLLNAKLRRDIIDYEELKKFSKEDINQLKKILKKKLYQITQTIDSLIDIKKSIKKSRKDLYSRPLSIEEIQTYYSKNLMPQNVLYKFLEKYYYFELINKLEKILDDKKIVSNDDIEQIKRSQKDFFSFKESLKNNNKKNILLKENKKIRIPKIDWESPHYKSHLMKLYRGTNRKTLKQIPYSRSALKKIITYRGLGTAQKVVNNAKKAISGIWKLTPYQVYLIANKYHHNPPDEKNPIKHLGNTGIMVWRKDKNNFFLIKPKKKKKI